MKTNVTNVTKVTLWVVDYNNLGEDRITKVIGDGRAHNFIGLHVRSAETKSVEWHNNHPLNLTDKCDAAFDELFGGPLHSAQAPETRDQETGDSILPTALFDPDATPQWTVTPKPVYGVFRLSKWIIAIAGDSSILLGDDAADEAMAWVAKEALKAPGPKT